MAQQDSLQFCPNCGAKLKSGAVFCGNCGFNIADYMAKRKSASNGSQPHQVSGATDSRIGSHQSSQQSASVKDSSKTARESQTGQTESVTKQATGNTPTRIKKPTKKWPWITAAIVLLILVGGYMFGKNYYSKGNQLKRAMTSVRKNDKNLAKNFEVSDKHFKLSNKSLQPLIKELDGKPSGMSQFATQLKNKGMTDDDAYSFAQSGRTWLLFPRYKIKAKTFSVKLRTNQPNVKLTVDGRHAFKTTSVSQSHNFGPHIAGQYELTAAGTVHGHHMKNDGNYWLAQDNASDVYLELKTISFTATGYPNAEVKVNGKSYGKLDSTGSLYLQDIPWSNNMVLTMVYSGDGGKITSNKRTINDSDQDTDVSVSFPGILSHDDAHTLISNVFSDMGSMSSGGEVPSDFSSFFVGGSANQHYKDLSSMATGYSKNKNINNVDYTVQDFHVVPNKVNETMTTYNVKYKFYGDGGATHTQVFQYAVLLDKNGDSGRIKDIHTIKKVSDTSTPGDDDSDSDSDSNDDTDSNSDSDSDSNDDTDSNSDSDSDDDTDSNSDSDSDSDDTDTTDDEDYQTSQPVVVKNLSNTVNQSK